jgi:hypothetical protein
MKIIKISLKSIALDLYMTRFKTVVTLPDLKIYFFFINFIYTKKSYEENIL